MDDTVSRGACERTNERRMRAATSTSFFSAWCVCTLGKPSKLLHPRRLFALRLRGKPEMSEFALGAARFVADVTLSLRDLERRVSKFNAADAT